MRQLITNYTFNAAAGTVTFNDFTNITLAALFAILDTTNNTIIYQANSASSGGTIAGNVLTLDYNTNTIAFSNSDQLQILYETATDNTVLDTQNSVSSTGTGNVYNTTGYQALSFQFAGLFSGFVSVEGSNDATNWFPMLMHNASDGSISDEINTAGVYIAPVQTLYIHYNVKQIKGSAAITVVGKVLTNVDSGKLLAMAADQATGVNINTNIAGGLKVDSTDAIVLSDNFGPINLKGEIGTIIILDTTGYQTFNVTSSTLAGTVFGSNDGITWSALSGVTTTAATYVATIIAAFNSVFPCTCRYIRITLTTAGAATGYLKNTPFNNYTCTNPYVAGGAQVSAGVNGVAAVGGNIGVGSAQTVNPLVVGGVDGNALTRRLLTDTAGRIAMSAVDSAGTVRAVALLPPGTNSQNVAALPISDVTSFEGNTQIEILALMLTELKVINYYLYNLPQLLNSGNGNPPADDPDNLRSDFQLTKIG